MTLSPRCQFAECQICPLNDLLVHLSLGPGSFSPWLVCPHVGQFSPPPASALPLCRAKLYNLSSCNLYFYGWSVLFSYLVKKCWKSSFDWHMKKNARTNHISSLTLTLKLLFIHSFINAISLYKMYSQSLRQGIQWFALHMLAVLQKS